VKDLCDPRSSAQYTRAARTYINDRRRIEISCALCGELVNMAASSMTPLGPTIEHRIPVRSLKAMTDDRAELLRLVCDQSWWAIAHSRCQSRQGAAVTNSKAQKSREW